MWNSDLVVRFWQAAVLVQWIHVSIPVKDNFNVAFNFFTIYLVWNRWHHLENLAAYEFDIWFYWIRNKNGPPKDTLGWFRTAEIFMWSYLKVIWIYLNYNELGFKWNCSNCRYKFLSSLVIVSGSLLSNESSTKYIWTEFILDIITPLKAGLIL